MSANMKKSMKDMGKDVINTMDDVKDGVQKTIKDMGKQMKKKGRK